MKIKLSLFYERIYGECRVKPTRKQLELLLVLNPFNCERVNYHEAADIIGISESCVKKRMHRFKKRCPEAYWKFRALRNEMTHGQRAIDFPRVYDVEFIEEMHANGLVKESF